jgi:hypothetical protein
MVFPRERSPRLGAVEVGAKGSGAKPCRESEPEKVMR